MNILDLPIIYNGLQMIVGAMRAREIVIREFIQPKRNDRILCKNQALSGQSVSLRYDV